MYNEIKLTTIFKPYKNYLIIDNQAMILQLLDKLYNFNEQINNENEGKKWKTILSNMKTALNY